MAERATTATRRRKKGAIIGSGVAAVVVLVLIIWVVAASGGKKKAQPSAQGSANASASTSAAPASCKWVPNPDPSASPAASPQPANTHLKNVGTPPASGEPRAGTRDMTIVTNLGTIVIRMDLAKAPCTAESFTYLASKHYFDNTSCHRLVNSNTADPQTGQPTDFHVLQCGDPSGTGQGGPSYTFPNETVPKDGSRPMYEAGQVAMANSGPDQNGSQFFIVYGDTTAIQNSYTLFGQVTTGLDIAKQVAAGGDDGTAGQAGGGKPKKPLDFKTVTVGPVIAPTASAAP